MSEIEISIFVDEQEVPLDRSQKELQYEELKKAGPHGAAYYELLFDLDEQIEKDKLPNTNMPEILAKWLMSYTIPVITTIVTEKLKKKEMFGLPIESEYSTRCLILGTKQIVYMAKGDQFQLHGILVPRPAYGKTLGYDYYSAMTICDMLQTGIYGPNLPLKGRAVGKYGRTKPIIFTDAEGAKKWMEKIIQYIIESKYIHEVLTMSRTDDISFSSCRELSSFELQSYEQQSYERPTNRDRTLVFEEFDEEILRSLDPIQPTKFISFYDNTLNALTQEHNLPIYYLGNLLGDNSKEFTDKIKIKKRQLEFDESFSRQVKDAQRAFNKLSLMKLIAIEKFKTSDLKSLNDKQKKIIELEYAKKEKEKNKQYDEKLAKLFGSLPFIHGKRLKVTLKEINDSAKEEIKKQDIIESVGICSHHFYKYFYIDEVGPIHLATDKLISDFALPLEDNSYYCKVCGEKLAEENVESSLNFFGDKTVNIGMTDNDQVQIVIWKEANNIVSTNVRFVDPIPTKSLINSLVAGLRNIVQYEEAQLFKSKNVDGSARDSLNLFAAIYIYAALAALMYHNPGKMTFAKERSNARVEKSDVDMTQVSAIKANTTETNTTEEKKQVASSTKTSEKQEKKTKQVETGTKTRGAGSAEVGPTKAKIRKGPRHLVVTGGKVVAIKDTKKAEEMTVRNALLLLIVSKDITRQKLNITVPMLSTMFSKAYKWALEHAKPIQIDRDIAKQLQLDPITFDAFYQYIHRVNLYSYFSGHRKFPPALNDIVSNIGKTKEKVMKATNPFDEITLEKPWKINLGEYYGLPKYEKFIYDCYQAVYEYLTQAVYTVPAVPMHVRLSDYQKKHEHLMQTDAEFSKIIKRRKIKPILHLELKNNLAWSLNQFNNVNVARHYCPSGNFHKGGEYIFAPKGKAKAKEERLIKKEEISAWIKTNDVKKLEEFANMEIVDEKCQLCGIHFRHTTYDDKTLQKIKKIHENQDNIYAFYSYYDTRCPVDNLHEIGEIKGVAECKKCGYNPNWKKQNDITEDPYYQKYGQQFREMRADQTKIEFMPFEYVEKKAEKPLTWEYSLRYTNELSKMFDVKYNILINLGLLEKISFIYIEQTKLNPSKEAYAQKARALRIRDYILFAIREYMEIVKYNEVAQIKIEIKKLLDDQKRVRPSDNLTENLPELPDFVTENEKYERDLPADKYTNYLQEFLAKMLIDIVMQSKERDKPFAKNVAGYILGVILRKDKYYSKAAPVFFKADATAVEEDLSDTDSVGSTDEVSSQFSDDSQEAANDLETENMDFNNDGYDVENEADIWEKD